jgi:hypothetical protein
MVQQNAQRTSAQNAYNWAQGGSGQMFAKPYTQESANQMLLNPFITNYLGIPGQQPSKPQYDLIRTGPTTKKYVKKGTQGDIPFYEKPDKPEDPDDNWGPIQYDKRLGFAYQVNKSTGAVKHLSGAGKDGKGSGKGGGKGDYTIQQMVDDNENHYAKELAQRTRSMLDQFGYVMPEYRQQFNAIQGEIIQKKQQDFYRINQNQRPSWLTGAGNPEQIQAIYNQLRNLGFNPAQIAEQLRQQGIQIE